MSFRSNIEFLILSRSDILFFFFYCCLFCFQDSVSLCVALLSGTYSVDQVSLELTEICLLGLKACVLFGTNTQPLHIVLKLKSKMVAHAYNLCTGEAEAGGSSLFYKLSSRPTRSTYWDLVSYRTKQKTLYRWKQEHEIGHIIEHISKLHEAMYSQTKTKTEELTDY